MAKISKTVVDKALRDKVFNLLFDGEETCGSFVKINDRQYGIILVDTNGVQRYVRIGAIVAEEREDMTAQELMGKEIDEYNAKQAEKAEKAQARTEKAKKDKAERERKQKIMEAEKKVVESIKAKKQEEEEDDPNQFLPHEITV